MNKRLLAGLLSITLALSMFTACGSSDDDDDDDESKAPKVSLTVDSEASPASEGDNSEGGESQTDAPAESEAPTDSTPTDTPAPSGNAGEPLTSALTKLGSFTYNSDMEIYKYIAIIDYDNKKGKMFDYMGKPVANGEDIEDIPYVEPELGLYSYGIVSDDQQFTYVGVFDAMGNEIIPISEKVGYVDTISSRYLALYYPEAITKNKDEAIYYSSNNVIAVNPDEDDVLYKGHICIFDLETKKLVPDLKYTTPTNIYGYGDIIKVGYDKYYGADGKELTFEKDNIEPNGNAFLFQNDREYKKYSILDHKKNKLFTLDKDVNPSSVSADDQYITVYKWDKSKDSNFYGIVDATGKTVVEMKYRSLSPMGGSFFKYQTGKDKYGILDAATGKEITKEEYTSIYDYNGRGVLTVKNDDGTFMFDTTGKQIAKAGENDSLSYTPYYIKDGDNYKMLNYSTKEFSIDVGTYYSDYLEGLLVEDKDNKIVYDTRTGEKVLEGYDKLGDAYGFFYAVYGDTVNVYQLQLQQP